MKHIVYSQSGRLLFQNRTNLIENNYKVDYNSNKYNNNNNNNNNDNNNNNNNNIISNLFNFPLNPPAVSPPSGLEVPEIREI